MADENMHESREGALALVDAALAYAARGWHVFPCHTPSPTTKNGCSCTMDVCDNIGKHPRTTHGLYDATVNASVIQRWWRMWPDANIGIRTGTVSNLVVVDEDTHKGGDLHALELAYSSLPETVEQLTGGGGRQLFFSHPGVDIPTTASKVAPGIDIRGDRGYAIAPPSLHVTGRRYCWEVTHDPDDHPLVPLPRWLQALCIDSKRHAPEDPAAIVGEGQRNQHLFLLGCSMRARGFQENAIYGALSAINTAQCQPPLGTEEVRRIAESCARYDAGISRNGTATEAEEPLAPGAPKTPYGDVYYAEWFVQLYGGVWRYCAVWKSWLHWIGTHWERDSQGLIMEDARATLRYVGHHAIDTDNETLIKHYAKSLNHQPLLRLIQQAQTLPGVAIDPTLLDQHPWLLNCRNGTVDLRTGRLRPHEKTDYLTRCLTCDYDATATAPTWERFLWRIMGGTVTEEPEDASAASLEACHTADIRAMRLIAFLQRALGYACTGDTSEECLFLFHGSGRNGKSKLLTTMQRLLGPYAKTADMNSFLHKDRETVRNDLADLNATRFVCASEVNEGNRFAEGLIKQLTGGDRIKARFLFQEYFEFQPEFKLFLAFNHKPTIRGTDDAIWTRIKLIPFLVAIPEQEQDKHLSDKLAEELPGILAWCIKGCIDWQNHGLGDPEEVRMATQEYRQESDYLQRFIEEVCVVMPEIRYESSKLYLAYKRWGEDNGEPLRSQTRFGIDLTSKGFAKVAGTGNRQYRVGIGIASTDEEGYKS